MLTWHPPEHTNNVADKVVDYLTYEKTPSASDGNTIKYISGYIARSVFKIIKCERCNSASNPQSSVDAIPLFPSLPPLVPSPSSPF